VNANTVTNQGDEEVKNDDEIVTKKSTTYFDLTRLKPSRNVFLALALMMLSVLMSYLYKQFLKSIK